MTNKRALSATAVAAAALLASSATCANAFVAVAPSVYCAPSALSSASACAGAGSRPTLLCLRSSATENDESDTTVSSTDDDSTDITSTSTTINGANGDAAVADPKDSSSSSATASKEATTEGVIADDTAAPQRTLLLNDLLRTASSCGRGEFATAADKSAMATIIADLEELNPTPDPTTSATTSIGGKWDLLYSDTQLFRSSPFFMAGRAVCTTPEQAEQYDWFCDMHRAALAISNIGKVRQIIDADGGRMVSEFEVKVGSIPFLSDFTPFAYSGGLPSTIDGAIVSSADLTPTDDGTAWEIFMDTVEIKGSNVPLLRRVLDGGVKLGSRDLGSFLEDNVDGYTNPRPVFSTTYLDDDVRISRDQDGKVFVYGRVSEDAEPTDYGGVDADLGLAKLLEGLNDSIFKFYI